MSSLLGSISIVLKNPVIRLGGPRHHPFDEVRQQGLLRTGRKRMRVSRVRFLHAIALDDPLG
jgi:hypothetical protein